MILNRIKIRNFKKNENIELLLQSPLVLIGPNNSGKTSLLQAITLLETGLKKIKAEKKIGLKRTTVSINRKDLISIPVPSAKLLWHKKNVREVEKSNGTQKTRNINIEIFAEGTIGGKQWQAGLEFDYANAESFYCRALRKDEHGNVRHSIDETAFEFKVAYLQPMSGLATSEDLLTPGSIDRKIGEGKTADIIRNICYQLLYPEKAIDAPPKSDIKKRWKEINDILNKQFNININEPVFNPSNGLLDMTYNENKIEYDLSSAGRGFQQTLLLLCFLYANVGKVILMDEPDAHLEVLRQREIYQLISDVTRKLGSQLIIASHSEIVLEEAASGEDQIIAIIEQEAIELNNQDIRKEVKKSLTDIGWDKYYLAKLKGHCLYVEGTTDEKNIRAYAKLLNHPCEKLLQEAFIDYANCNMPVEVYNRFKSIKLVKPDIKGLALFDKLDVDIYPNAPIKVMQWTMKELENYFCTPEIFIRWAASIGIDLFTNTYESIMKEVINDIFPKLYLSDRSADFWKNEKMSEWAERIFTEFFKKIEQPVNMRKSNYHELIALLTPPEVHPEITEKLDAIYEVIK